jgi:hypothetical protein
LIVRSRRTAARGLLLLIAPAAIEPWRIWLGDHGLPTSAHDYHLSSLLDPTFLAHQSGRLPYAIEGLLTAEFRPSEWLPILPLAIFAILVASRRVPWLAAAAAAWILLASLGLVFVYWIGNMPVTTYVNETAHRVSGTIVIVTAVFVPLLFGLALDAPSRPRFGRPAMPP